jgi:hypothetical protein
MHLAVFGLLTLNQRVVGSSPTGGTDCKSRQKTTLSTGYRGSESLVSQVVPPRQGPRLTASWGPRSGAARHIASTSSAAAFGVTAPDTAFILHQPLAGPARERAVAAGCERRPGSVEGVIATNAAATDAPTRARSRIGDARRLAQGKPSSGRGGLMIQRLKNQDVFNQFDMNRLKLSRIPSLVVVEDRRNLNERRMSTRRSHHRRTDRSPATRNRFRFADCPSLV